MQYSLGRTWVAVSVPMAMAVRVTLIQCGPVRYAAPVHKEDAVQEVFEENLSY